jgi:hypothetical protein
MDSWNNDYMSIKSEPPNHTFTHFSNFKLFLMIQTATDVSSNALHFAFRL